MTSQNPSPQSPSCFLTCTCCPYHSQLQTAFSCTVYTHRECYVVKDIIVWQSTRLGDQLRVLYNIYSFKGTKYSTFMWRCKKDTKIQNYHRDSQKSGPPTLLLLPINKFHFTDIIPKVKLTIKTLKTIDSEHCDLHYA